MYLCKISFRSCHMYIPYNLVLASKWIFVDLLSKKWKKTYSPEAKIRTLRPPQKLIPFLTHKWLLRSAVSLYPAKVRWKPHFSLLIGQVPKENTWSVATLRLLFIFFSDNILRRATWLSELPLLFVLNQTNIFRRWFMSVKMTTLFLLYKAPKMIGSCPCNRRKMRNWTNHTLPCKPDIFWLLGFFFNISPPSLYIYLVEIFNEKGIYIGEGYIGDFKDNW